ncbi:MAG TPA: hypothetical protein VFX98_02710 [Longimicrobiaceae bacterium]|nr:hypothetical protein [Longimicrobiaceae bacterium]
MVHVPSGTSDTSSTVACGSSRKPTKSAAASVSSHPRRPAVRGVTPSPLEAPVYSRPAS